MRTYPLTRADVISQEDVHAGRVHLMYHYHDVTGMVNRAFYDGFIVGICDDKNAFDSITPEAYTYAAITAVQALAKLQGRPDPVEERRKAFQETYRRDLRKTVQRQAESGAVRPIRGAISSMLPLIQDADKLREVLMLVAEICSRPQKSTPGERA